MHNSKLLQIIKSFNQGELDDFSTFLSAGFVKDSNPEELKQLLSLFYSHLPDLTHPDLKKENTFKWIFGNLEYNPGKMDKLLTRLLKVVYQYISIYFNHKYSSPQSNICYFLQNKGLKPILDRELGKWVKSLDQNQFCSSEILFERYLHKELIVSEQASNINPKVDLELPSMLLSLDQYYVLTKLQFGCQLLAVNTFLFPVNVEKSIESFRYLEHIINLPHLQIPIIKVYYQAYKMLDISSELDLNNFEDFKTILDKYNDDLSEDQRKTLNALIRSYVTFQYHNGKEGFLKNAFEVYKDHQKKGYLNYNGKILAQPFRNLVTLGLRLKETEWVYNFLQEHKGKITGSKKPDLIYDFNLSMYYFQIKEYDKAMENLPETFDDTYYKLGVKRLELMIYMETRSLILESKILAFKAFIYRLSSSKITEKQKKANNNFIHLLRQINNIKTEFNADRIKKLKLKVEQHDLINEKEWFIDILTKMLEKA